MSRNGSTISRIVSRLAPSGRIETKARRKPVPAFFLVSASVLVTQNSSAPSIRSLTSVNPRWSSAVRERAGLWPPVITPPIPVTRTCAGRDQQMSAQGRRRFAPSFSTRPRAAQARARVVPP